MRRLLKEAEYELSQEELNSLDTSIDEIEGTLMETIDEENLKEIRCYDELIELRDYSLLPRKPTDEEEEEDEQIFEILKNFCNIINEIEKINQMLEKIEQKGYNETIKIIIEINDNILSYIINGNKIDNFQSCYVYLNNLLHKLSEIQINYYKNEELIKFIYGKQFNLFNSCLRKEKQSQSLMSLLKFLTNDKGDSINIFKNFYYH